MGVFQHIFGHISGTIAPNGLKFEVRVDFGHRVPHTKLQPLKGRRMLKILVVHPGCTFITRVLAHCTVEHCIAHDLINPSHFRPKIQQGLNGELHVIDA